MGRFCIFLVPLAAILWTGLVFAAPWTVGWRDSGEFLLTAVFLDIPHPAGFPVYSVLSNLFTFLPFGHLAWRVHLFQGAVGLLLLYQTYWLALDSLDALNLRTRASRWLALCSPLIVLLSEPFVRGAVSAEVYTLHALFLTGVLRCLARFHGSRDARYLYTGAALGGLSLGNHAAAILAAVWIFASLLIFRALSRYQAALSLLFVIAGAAVYAYLPVRATQNPPLNTGRPDELVRFIRHTTDERDRALRAPEPAHAPRDEGTPAIRMPQIAKDLGKLSLSMGILPVVVGLGTILVAIFSKAKSYALSMLGVLATNLFFFSNWDPDPWIPSIVMIAVGAVLALSVIMKRVAATWYGNIATACAAAGLVLCAGLRAELSVDHLLAQRTFDVPVSVARNVLDSVPRHGMAITEPSWFICRYLQQLEGYRQDVLLLYLPSLLFPAYFNPSVLTSGTERVVSTEGDEHAAPRFENVANALRAGVKNGAALFELTQSLAAPFREVLLLDRSGRVFAIERVNGAVDPGYTQSRAAQLGSLKVQAQDLPVALKADTMNYVEVSLAHDTAALQVLGHTEDACRLALITCPPETGCGDRIERYTSALCAVKKTR